MNWKRRGGGEESKKFATLCAEKKKEIELMHMKKSITQVLSHNLVNRVILTRISTSLPFHQYIFWGKDKVLFGNCMLV